MPRSAQPAKPPLDTPTGWRPVSEITPMGGADRPRSHYDWLVVGTGFTGLSAARRLAELRPDDSVLLVDAKPVGWGASGRNSGFVIDLPHKYDLDEPDVDRLRKIIRLNRAAIDDLEALIETHEIACDWSRAGKLQGAVRKRGAGMMNAFMAALDRVGEPYQRLDRGGCREIMGTDYYEGAVFTPGSALVDPLSLVRGLARSQPENVTLLDETPVEDFDAAGGRVSALLSFAEGDRQEVTADAAILAVDPYTPEFDYQKNRILPVLTFASITRPLTERELRSYSGKLNWGLTPADAAGTTMRMTADARLLIRNHYAHAPDYKASDENLARVRKAQREGIDARYPHFSHVPFAATWGGVCGLSRNHVSFFGKLDENVYGANCYNGVGIAKGAMSGKLLADLVTGQDSAMLRDMQDVTGMPSKIPSSPIRALGVTARMKLAEWESRDER